MQPLPEITSFAAVRALWCELADIDPANIPVQEAARFGRLFARWARRGWEWYFWPELMLTEERRFRAEWTATGYPAGAEVYHGDSYWVANDATLAGDVPGASAKWDPLTMLDAYIAYGQAGHTPLGTVEGIYREDPRQKGRPQRLPYRQDERGYTLTGEGVPASVWVRFRRRCPRWEGAEFSPSATYAAGVTRYYASATEGFAGDYWLTLDATTAGQDPEDTPAKWQRLEIPRFLHDFVAHGCAEDRLRADGQLEKAVAEEAPAWTYLYDERDQRQNQGGPSRRVRFAR